MTHANLVLAKFLHNVNIGGVVKGSLVNRNQLSPIN